MDELEYLLQFETCGEIPCKSDQAQIQLGSLGHFKEPTKKQWL